MVGQAPKPALVVYAEHFIKTGKLTLKAGENDLSKLDWEAEIFCNRELQRMLACGVVELRKVRRCLL